MKATIGCEPSISRVYSDEVFKAVMDSGLQSYTTDNDFYILKYNGVWETYDKLSRKYSFLGLPVLNLSELETQV